VNQVVIEYRDLSDICKIWLFNFWSKYTNNLIYVVRRKVYRHIVGNKYMQTYKLYKTFWYYSSMWLYIQKLHASVTKHMVHEFTTHTAHSVKQQKIRRIKHQLGNVKFLNYIILRLGIMIFLFSTVKHIRLYSYIY